MKKNETQISSQNIHGQCPKCGHTYECEDGGTMPRHKVMKGAGSRVVIICKGSGQKASK